MEGFVFQDTHFAKNSFDKLQGEAKASKDFKFPTATGRRKNDNGIPKTTNASKENQFISNLFDSFITRHREWLVAEIRKEMYFSIKDIDLNTDEKEVIVVDKNNIDIDPLFKTEQALELLNYSEDDSLVSMVLNGKKRLNDHST